MKVEEKMDKIATVAGQTLWSIMEQQPWCSPNPYGWYTTQSDQHTTGTKQVGTKVK